MKAAIFVVEDQLMVARSTAALLRSKGHDVVIETDAEKALAILIGPTKFDVTFLDLLMPGGLNGSDIYAVCKKEAPARCKRIVFFTGIDYLVPEWIRLEGVLVIGKGGSETAPLLLRTVQQFAELDCSRGPTEEKAIVPKTPNAHPSHPEIPALYDDEEEVNTGVLSLVEKSPSIPREIKNELRIRYLHSSHKEVKQDVATIKTDVAATKTDLGTLKTEITTTVKTSAKWLGIILVLAGGAAWLVEHVAFKK